MQTTMNLLERALKVAPIPTWTERLKLSRDAIATAKMRGKLSPVIAVGLAVELGDEPTKWGTLAALEAATDNPAKRAVMKTLEKMHTW